MFNDRIGESIQVGDNFFSKISDNLKPYKPDLINEMEGIYTMAQEGVSQNFESIIYSSDGKQLIYATFLSPIKIKGKKKFDLACLAVDLTYKKETELKLRKLLNEKEILLKEVHHRVKNNLQVISSILNLQSSYVKDQQTLDILRESQNRIKAMSFIHESLYRSDDFSFVNFSSYINSLSSNLVQTYIIEHGNIKLELDLGDANLSLDQAIPCGLIINELVSNSIKYAFPSNKQGKIRIELKKEDNKIYLKVSDNGIGLPDNLDVENTDTLGLQLVYILISQLDGDIKVINKKGTTFLLNFTIQN
jgi:two-component sensor histidine kinase